MAEVRVRYALKSAAPLMQIAERQILDTDPS
jgi:hypothetical protein